MKVAILGYGNIGRAAEQAINAAPEWSWPVYSTTTIV